jgi:TonB-dependent starch-binding outer membrane protein SusC
MKNKFYFFKNVFAILILLAFSLSVQAQDRRVTGKVTALDGQGLPGATIQIKGSQTGVTSDANGGFGINVKSGNDVIVVSSVGYKSREIKVGTQSTVNVTLDEDVSALGEVVVTGYSSQQKRDITGAVSTIKTKDLISVPSADFAGQLQGRAAGVQVGQSGEPGAGVAVRIRGISTFGDNNPLYVIDGVPTQGAYQNAFNANDIESIQILKDASAASIYGSRASNGVIIITTKKGGSGKTIFTYDGSYGTQSAANKIDLLTNSQDYANLVWEGYRNGGIEVPRVQYGTGATPVIPDYIVPSAGKLGSVDESKYSYDPNNPNLITRSSAGTDWQSEIFKTAAVTQHNIGIQGGNAAAKFSLGLNYFDQQGIAIATNFRRYTFRANSDFNLGKYIKIGENLSLSYINQVNLRGGNQNEGNVLSNIIKTQPAMPVYDIAGNFAGIGAIGFGNGYNPVAQAIRNKDNPQQWVRLFGNTFAEAKILKDFTLKTSIGVDYGIGFGTTFNYYDFERGAEKSSSNSFQEFAQYGQTWVWTNTLTYDKKFGTDHVLKAYVGYEAVNSTGRRIDASRAQYFTEDQNAWTLGSLANPASQTNGSYTWSNSLASIFGRAEYSFMDKYLLSATVRRDGSSNFGPANRYAVFPAASVGWRISQEKFMKDLAFIYDMKVRVGWGQTGNQNIPGGNAFSTYGGGSSFSNYAINGSSNSVASGFAPNQLGNPLTKWETQTSTNIGLDVSLLKGKIDVNLDWYTRKTSDLLFNVSNPGTAGLANAPYINVGAMENKGIDLGITYRNTIGKLRYEATGNFSTYKNKILTIDGSENGNPFYSNGSRINNIIKNASGTPISSFWGYQIAGIFQTQAEVDASNQASAKVGRWKFKDVSGDGKINGDDLTFIGNPHPDFTYGVNLSASYGGWDVTAYFQGVSGNDIWNDMRWFTDFESTFPSNKSIRLLKDSWSPTNPNALLPKNDASDNQPSLPVSYYLEKGSYFRAKNIEVGYSFPASTLSKMGMSRLRVYLQTTNLFTITKYTGYDPDITQRNPGDQFGSDKTIGVDYGNYPKPRIFTLGVNLKF